MSNEIQIIVKWFSDAKPNPTIEDACVQIGCHYEEVGEMAAATGDGDVHSDCDNAGYHYKAKNKNYLSDLELLYKDDEVKIELLDSLCDQIVTAVGVGHMLNLDIAGALNEVIASNDSKRMPDGSFPLDENGKIAKESPNFFKPDLSKFIGSTSDK